MTTLDYGALVVGGGHGQLEAQQISCSQCHTHKAIEVVLLALKFSIIWSCATNGEMSF